MKKIILLMVLITTSQVCLGVEQEAESFCKEKDKVVFSSQGGEYFRCEKENKNYGGVVEVKRVELATRVVYELYTRRGYLTTCDKIVRLIH